MKTKLTADEAGSVTGGTTVSCNVVQVAEIIKSYCPLCGDRLIKTARGAARYARCRNSSCGMLFTSYYPDQWTMDNGEDDG